VQVLISKVKSVGVAPEYLVFGALVMLYPLLILGLPGLVIPFAVLPVVLIGAFLLVRRPWTVPLLAVMSAVFVVYNKPGFDLGEAVYYLFWLSTVFLVLVPSVYRGEVRLETPLDKQYALFMGLMLLGVLTGFLYSEGGLMPVREALYFYSGVVFYFAFRPWLGSERFRWMLFGAFAVVFVYVVVSTYISYRMAILSAVAEWELNYARGAGNENFLLIGTIMSAVALLYARKTLHKAAMVLLFLVTAGAVVLTLTRSLWVVSILSLGIVGLLVDGPRRRRFAGYLAVAGIIVVAVAMAYLDYTLFVLELLAFRFQSILDGTRDLSIAERIIESQRVWERIRENPVGGWGFGLEYLRYDLLKERTSSYSLYIHNGYLAVWYKTGLLGLITMLAYGVTLFIYARRTYRMADSIPLKILGLTLMAYLPSAALMNMTSPVLYNFEGTMLLFTFGTVLSWHILRMSKVGFSRQVEVDAEGKSAAN
jgi:O-antigen ligase